MTHTSRDPKQEVQAGDGSEAILEVTFAPQASLEVRREVAQALDALHVELTGEHIKVRLEDGTTIDFAQLSLPDCGSL